MKRKPVLDSYCLRCGANWTTYEDSLDDECPVCDQKAKPTVGGAPVQDGLTDLPFVLDDMGRSLILNQMVDWSNIKFKRIEA